MGPKEARLRAMLNPNSLATWNLNSEDKEAVQWAFDRIATLEAQVKEYQDRMASEYSRRHPLRTNLDRAIQELMKVQAGF